MAVAPGPAWPVACDDKLGETVQLTGSYVTAGQAYARTFVFAIRVDCQGTAELVTVQRSTGKLPICELEQPVEVVGKLAWNRALFDGHYEINNPSSVTCLPVARMETKDSERREAPPPAPASPATPASASPKAEPSARAEPPAKPEARRVEVSAVTIPREWMGRYQDSRGGGDLTFMLVRGTSTVSGTWKFRTGGGGPLAGSLDGAGRRLQFRMENVAAECPGTFEGTAEISDTTLIGTYSGRDCMGAVSGGHLELRLRE
jgi:hypothetical protein